MWYVCTYWGVDQVSVFWNISFRRVVLGQLDVLVSLVGGVLDPAVLSARVDLLLQSYYSVG
jgi:hypothetical protein